MLKPRAKLLPDNPEAIVYTSRGWRYPDGTVKPFYQPRVQALPKPTLWQRVFAKQHP